MVDRLSGMDRDTLVRLIRQKLGNGSLPQDGIARVWGSPGNREICDACVLVIDQNQFVMEGAFRDGRKRGIQFHVKCFQIWDAERTVPAGADPRGELPAIAQPPR